MDDKRLGITVTCRKPLHSTFSREQLVGAALRGQLVATRIRSGTRYRWRDWRKSCLKPHRKPTSVSPQGRSQVLMGVKPTRDWNTSTVEQRLHGWTQGHHFEVCLLCFRGAREKKIPICNDSFPPRWHYNTPQQWPIKFAAQRQITWAQCARTAGAPGTLEETSDWKQKKKLSRSDKTFFFLWSLITSLTIITSYVFDQNQGI